MPRLKACGATRLAASTRLSFVTWPPASGSETSRTSSWSARPASAKHNQHSTPFLYENCEGKVTVIDQTHPLHGQTFRLVGLARPPRMGRCCMVEKLPNVFGHIPISSTNFAKSPKRVPTLLRVEAVERLVRLYDQAVREVTGRGEDDIQLRAVESSRPSRKGSRRRPNRTNPRGGAR